MPQEVKNGESLWSFNHRTRVHVAFDSSDSEFEAETSSKINIPSDDTRLVQELDISSRHETVEYKPNPWSIARINAASRAPNQEPRTEEISKDTRQKPNPRAPQGRIVDAFKVQAERKPPRAPVTLKAVKVTKPKSNTLRVSREDQVCIQTQGKGSAEPGDYLQHDNASFLVNGSNTRPSHTPAILSSNAPQQDLHDLRLQPRPCVPTLSCSPISKRDGIQTSQEPPLQRSMAHISTPDMSRMSQSRFNVPFTSMSSPLTSCDYQANASRLRPQGYQSSPPRPSHRNVNTPPGLLPCDQYFSHFRRGVRVIGNQRFQALPALHVPQVLAKESRHPISPAMVEVESPSMPQWLASTLHGSLNPPKAQAEFFERVSSPVRDDDDLVSPESRKRPYQSPTPSPLPHRAKRSMPKRNVRDSPVSRSGHGISAYAFDNDPDANWSTIMKPEKKKSNKFKLGNMQTSGPFRLRGIAVGNPKDRGTGVIRAEKKQDIQKKRRVITYLPPPPLQRTVAPNENPSQVEERYAPDNDALPTPVAQPPQESGPASPLLQADSDDLTLVGEVDEQVFAFDAGGVEVRYPKIRKLIKETRVKLPELLGLPSCGIVWRDDGVASADGTESGNREMKISIWPCVG